MARSVLSASVGTATSLAPRFGARPRTVTAAACLQPRSSTVARSSAEAYGNVTLEQKVETLQAEVKALRAEMEAMAKAQLAELKAANKQNAKAYETVTEEQSVEKLQEKLQAMKAQREADVQAQRDELEAESKQNTRAMGVILLLAWFTFQLLRRAYSAA